MHLMHFAMETAKVNFAISYLQGIALSWFKPELLDLDKNNPPQWYIDYNHFVGILTRSFMPFDTVTDVENKLGQLQMHKDHHINRFLVDFQCLASLIRWGDSALHFQFYKAMPSHIKDEISCVRKPDTLNRL